MWPGIIFINDLISASIFIAASLVSGVVYSFLNTTFDSSKSWLFILELLVCFAIFYLFLATGVILYYRLLLAFIPEKETKVSFRKGGERCQKKQLLRLIAAGALLDIAQPLFRWLPVLLKLFTVKSGGNLLLRGRILGPELLEFGDNVNIAQDSLIYTHIQETDGAITFKKVKIGKNCLIGIKSVIFPGVVIGDNSIIAAASVVPKDTEIPANEIWGGVPARKIKEIDL